MLNPEGATKISHNSTYPSIDPTRSNLSLVGKSVVVTGGGSGIGLEISKALARAGAAKLAIIGRRTDILAKAKDIINELVDDNTEVFTVSADVGNKEQVDKAISQISTVFGGKPLDIRVNNAGYFTGLRPFGEETIDEWTTAFKVNTLAVYLDATAFIRHVIPNVALINISSALAHLPAGFRVGFSSYGATKLAGVKIMEYVMAEHPSLHVVNIHPGQVVETEMAGKLGTLPHIDDDMLPFEYY